MTKVVVPDIDSGYNLTQINVALQALATELNDKVLYRTNPAGEPNSMNNNLDMNSFQILNLPAPATQNSPARLRDVQAAVAGIVPASLIPFTPAGTISSTTVQSAIEEVNTEAATARNTIVSNLAASTGSNTVGHIAAAGTSRSRTVRDKLRDIEIAANDIVGIDPNGDVNSYSALNDAIAATPEGGTLVLNGFYRSSQLLTIPKTMKIKGKSSRIGNLSDYTKSKSVILFDTPVSAGLVGVDVQLTLEDVVIACSVTNEGDGIQLSGGNSALILKEGSLVQGFNVGLRLTEGDYHKIEGSIQFCKTGIIADGCYNLSVHRPTIRCSGTGSNGITLLNFSQLTMGTGSLENFTGYGIGAFGGSTVDLRGTYFEGEGGDNILAASNTAITANGCRVYLNTGTVSWIKRDGAATGVRITSKGNTFVYPTDTRSVALYDLNTADAGAYTDISGDNWASPIGANVKYLADGVFSGAGPVALTGNHSVEYPMGHPQAHKNLSTKPIAIYPAVSAVSGTPLTTMMLPYAAQGFTGDDPIGLRTANGGAWGANPYMAVYHKGQWEKVGLRLTNITNVSGGATVDTEARAAINNLLAQFRAAGVMP